MKNTFKESHFEDWPEFKSKALNSSTKYSLIMFSISAFLLCIVVISFIRKSYSGTPITFSSFLNWLGNLNTFQIRISISDFVIRGDWLILNPLRDFFNIFAALIGVVVWLSANLFNGVVFIGQFLYFIFV